MFGEFHESLSRTLDRYCWSLNAACSVVVPLWLCLHILTSQSLHQPSTWGTWEGLHCPWQISYWCELITSPCLKSLLICPFCWYCLVLSKKHSFLPSVIPISAVVVISRLQFSTTEGCPDTSDQIVCYERWSLRAKSGVGKECNRFSLFSSQNWFQLLYSTVIEYVCSEEWYLCLLNYRSYKIPVI
jgi:hypothetical protein